MEGICYIELILIAEEDKKKYHMITDKEKKPCPVKFPSTVLISKSQS